VATIKNEKDLERWLKDQPDEVARVIASRAALSAIPFLARYVGGAPRRRGAAIVLPCFRGHAPPWFAGNWPNQGGEGFDTAGDAAGGAAWAAAGAAAWAAARDAAGDAARSAAGAAARAAAGAAARDAARAARDAARDAIWVRLNDDTNSIDAGISANELATKPIWLAQAPVAFAQRWSQLKQLLLSLDENWQVWTNWYDDRLAGAEVGRPLILELERERILIPNEIWKQGPAVVNAVIVDLEDKYRRPRPSPTSPATEVSVPDQQPAIIEVELGDDVRLHRTPASVAEAGNVGREEALGQAWRAHRTLLDALEALDPGRNWPALKNALAAYGAAMGTGFDDFRVIELGVHGLRIIALANKADKFLMDDIAGEVKTLAMAHGLFIGQFDAWHDYMANAQGKPPAEAVQAAAGLLRVTPEHNEVIGEDVTMAALMIVEAATPESPLSGDVDAAPVTSAMDNETVRSVRNLLAGLVAPIASFIGATGGAAHAGTIEGIKSGTKWAAHALTILGLTEVGQLVGLLPAQFGWITAAMTAIKAKFGL
jgi:hypothetical protein